MSRPEGPLQPLALSTASLDRVVQVRLKHVQSQKQSRVKVINNVSHEKVPQGCCGGIC